MIKIKTEKIIDLKGERVRKITEIKALLSIELPENYWLNTDKEHVYFTEDGMFYINNPKIGIHKAWMVGSIILESQFQAGLEIIKRAGEHLQEVNQQIKKKKEEWHGEETFKI